MRLKNISVGNTQIKNNVFLAPMAGYTDCAFRAEILSLGAGLVFTELVSAKGMYFGGSNNASLTATTDHNKTAVQIFGAEEYYMRYACECEELKDYKIVDINMGCPVPKVYKNGEGSALLKDIKKAESIVKECVKSGKDITVKIRTGLKRGDDIATEYAKMCEDAGAKLITIHGRVRDDYYSGEPDFNAIAKAKRAVNIPVIANGGIFTEEDADLMMERTGADGVMIARGGISDPFLFARLTGTKTDGDLKAFIIRHLNGMKTFLPDRKAAVEFRKFVSFYFKGLKNSKDLKLKIMATQTVDEIISIIKENL